MRVEQNKFICFLSGSRTNVFPPTKPQHTLRYATQNIDLTMKILLFGNEYQQHYAGELRHLVDVLRRYGVEIEVERSFYQYLRYVLGITIDKDESKPACKMDKRTVLACYCS